MDHSREPHEQAGWDAHAAFINALAEEGVRRPRWPRIDEGDGSRFLFVIDADSETMTRARLAVDPWPEDLLRIESIRPWSVWLRASHAA